jgi:hypothetical protein
MNNADKNAKPRSIRRKINTSHTTSFENLNQCRQTFYALRRMGLLREPELEDGQRDRATASKDEFR